MENRVIKDFYSKKWTATQIKAELDEVHGAVEAIAPEMIEKIHCIVMEDHRIMVREIVEIVGISVGAVHNILHEKLEMKRCVPDGCRDC